jgi:hypothetical protein
MQSDLDSALSEVSALTSLNAALTQERDMLRAQLNTLQADRDFWMIRATEQTAVIENVSSTLISGITRQRRAQEHRATVPGANGLKPPPMQLTTNLPAGSVAGSEPASSGDHNPNPPQQANAAPEFQVGNGGAGASTENPRRGAGGAGGGTVEPAPTSAGAAGAMSDHTDNDDEPAVADIANESPDHVAALAQRIGVS